MEFPEEKENMFGKEHGKVSGLKGIMHIHKESVNDLFPGIAKFGKR